MNECCSVSNSSKISKQNCKTSFLQSHRTPLSPLASTDKALEIEDCCSSFGKKLNLKAEKSPSFVRNQHYSSPSFASPQASPSIRSLSSSSPYNCSSPIMTIGHFGHSRHNNSSHHQNHNHHHYGYHSHHDAYHDDSQMLPRIDFPSSQFDRLLRGPSPNNNNNNSHSRHFSHRHFGSSNNSSPSDRNDRNNGDTGSWKSGLFDSRKK